MPGRRTSLLLPLLAVALLACDELPIIEENRCGNGFIEPGEDCDAFGATAGNGMPGSEATCNAPNEDNECHFHCENTAQCQSAPVSKDGSGWRCGADKVCRRPLGDDSGRGPFFTPVSSLIPGGADDLFSGDFDGDGRKDLLAVGAAGFDVHYFTRDSSVAKSLHVPGAPVVPGIGKLTATAADDFTIDVGQGIGVMLGRLGQTIDPTSYASLDVKQRYQGDNDTGAPDDMSLIIVDIGATVEAGPSMTKQRLGPGPLALAVNDGTLTLIDASADTQKGRVTLDTFLDIGSKPLLGTIPVAFPKVGAERQRFLLAYENEASVYVMDAGAPAMPPMKPPIKSSIDLRSGFTVHGAAFFGDANDDGFTDVFVGAADCSKGVAKCDVAEIEVAYGDGEGAFSSVPKSDPAWTPAALGKASSLVNVYPSGDPQPKPKGEISAFEIERYLPLAVGWLNADSKLDYVNAFGIYISNGGDFVGCNSAPNGYCEADRPSGGQLWSEVKVGDFNANGRLDVAAVSRGNPGIDFFSGTGEGVFNTFSIPTERAPSSLSVGDFDGDFLPDLAFDSATTRVDGDVHAVFVAFGRASGAPEIPVSMGEVANLRQIVSGNLSSFANDAASDIVLLSGIPAKFDAQGKKTAPGASWKVGLSQGNGYRQLQAPLLFFGKNNIQVEASPLASAIGSFDGDTPVLPATTSHPDVAAIVQRFKPNDSTKMGGPPFCSLEASLWMLPALGDAAIEPPALGGTSLALPDNFLPVRRLVETVPIDLDGESIQGLLIAFPSYDDCKPNLADLGAHGELLLARFDAGGKPTVTPLIPSVGDNEYLLRLRVGDIDGDGIADIAALQTKLDITMGQITSTSVVVILGKGGGAFAPPLPVPMDGIPTDLALVNADGERDLELVVVSAYTNPVDLSAELVVVDWDKSATDATMPFKKTRLPRSNGDSPTDNSAITVLDRPTALAGGDFDGDGVDDIAVAIAGGIRVLKGAAR